MVRHTCFNRAILVCLSVMVAGCAIADSSSYFVRLDPIGEARVKEKYGDGLFYFHYSRYRFSNYKNVEEERIYLGAVENETNRKKVCLGGLSIINESISYYSEGGEVSVLVKCDN